jgi:hypothetical protein
MQFETSDISLFSSFHNTLVICSTTYPISSMPGTTPTLSALSAFTPETLVRRYPNLPRWAISAFFEIKHSKDYMLSPDARTLLNITVLPMPGCNHNQDYDTLLDCNVKMRDLFVSDESYRDNQEHVDLCRLSHGIAKIWKD